MKIYVAGSKQLFAVVRAIIEVLTQAGHEITYDWTARPLAIDAAEGECAALNELQGINLSDAVIILQPGGYGTHIEIGIALAMRKPIIMLHQDGRWEHAGRSLIEHPDLRDPAGSLCAFFCMASIAHVHEVDAVMRVLVQIEAE